MIIVPNKRRTNSWNIVKETLTLVPSAETGGLWIISTAGDINLLVGGRQVVTRERIEVLGLALVHPVDDGLSLRETHEEIKRAGGITVLPWAPGKWWFERGRVIREFLRSIAPNEALLGDIVMRPQGKWIPPIMKTFETRGGAHCCGK